MSNYDELIAIVKKVSTLGSIGGLLGWDQETMMPPGGLWLRAEEKTLIASLSHEWFTDTKVGELIIAAKKEELTDDKKANVREIEWSYVREKLVPSRWVEEFERVTTEALEVWKEARSKKDFSMFAPSLKKIVELSQEYAKLVNPNKKPYEVLVESFERGIEFKDIERHFEILKNELPTLIRSIQSKAIPNYQNISIEKQKVFVKKLAKLVGYDFEKGRLDESTHPFTGYFGRITTRYEDWTSTIMSTIHEAGHGMYEHGLLAQHFGTPLGEAGSFSLHEGMSRFWENNIGRSMGFWKSNFPKMKEIYGLTLSLEEFYSKINMVKPGFIRVDADELTYTMHIILRFEIEKEIIEGTLAVDDIPNAWNAKMQKYLDITPLDDSLGCLQDTHWACGMFGYFPCYTLGSMIAAQIYASAEQQIPNLSEQINEGHLQSLHSWLNKNIYVYGQRYRTSEHIKLITGKDLSTDDYLKYLRAKIQTLTSSLT